MKIVEVMISAKFEVEFNDDVEDDHIQFIIEENSCPGTGIVGAKLEEIMRKSYDKNYCWACNCSGENKILSIRRNNNNEPN